MTSLLYPDSAACVIHQVKRRGNALTKSRDLAQCRWNTKPCEPNSSCVSASQFSSTQHPNIRLELIAPWVLGLMPCCFRSTVVLNVDSPPPQTCVRAPVRPSLRFIHLSLCIVSKQYRGGLSCVHTHPKLCQANTLVFYDSPRCTRSLMYNLLSADAKDSLKAAKRPQLRLYL